MSQSIKILKFTSQNCNPCRVLERLLANVESELPPDAELLPISVEGSPELCEKYEIRSVPSILIEYNGEVVRHLTGVVPREKLLRVVAEVVSEIN